MNNINNISPSDNSFLNRLKNIDKPPKKLWYLGNLPENRTSVAIVGSRKPTNYGRAITVELASTLAKRGVIIVSGLAIGHDSLAQRACLEAGGTTIGVLANGLDTIYPASNTQLARQIIAQGGALISEYPPATPIFKHQFLARNRLVSGLADLLIIVEAGERSGTLNTASHALNQGCDIMAVPGNITSPLSYGCNKLIAQGATPVLSVHDVLAKLNLDEVTSPSVIHFNSPLEKQIYQLICNGVSSGDELINQTKAEISQFNIAMTMLELGGYIQSLGANNWAKL